MDPTASRDYFSKLTIKSKIMTTDTSDSSTDPQPYFTRRTKTGLSAVTSIAYRFSDIATEIYFKYNKKWYTTIPIVSQFLKNHKDDYNAQQYTSYDF